MRSLKTSFYLYNLDLLSNISLILFYRLTAHFRLIIRLDILLLTHDSAVEQGQRELAPFQIVLDTMTIASRVI